MSKSKKPDSRSARNASQSAADRRRVGTVVHDDRGNASVKWRDAPADLERTPLKVEDTQPQRGLSTRGLAIASDDTFNPYTRVPDGDRVASDHKSVGTRTDLRRLSAWIKMMRQLEEHKRRIEGEGEGEGEED